MTKPTPPSLPTLTEVVELKDTGPAALPPQGDAVALNPQAAAALKRLNAASAKPKPDELRLKLRRVQQDEDELARDEELVARVMARLQPRLEVWVETQVRKALMELPVWAEASALSVAHSLRTELPSLVSLALEEVYRELDESGPQR